MNKRFCASIIVGASIAAGLTGCGGGGGGSTPSGPFGNMGPNAFQYVSTTSPAPVSPRSGAAAGGNLVTLTGKGVLVAPITVYFGTTQGTSASIGTNTANSTQVTVLSPADPNSTTKSDTVDIRIVDANGVSAVSSNDQFTYVPSPPPPPG